MSRLTVPPVPLPFSGKEGIGTISLADPVNDGIGNVDLSDAAYVGSGIPKRGPFCADLVDSALAVSLLVGFSRLSERTTSLQWFPIVRVRIQVRASCWSSRYPNHGSTI